MNKKKILALVLVAALLLTAIGGTLAYFTDTEEATNVFTVGNVDIQLLESRYYTNVDTDKTPDDIRADAKTYADYLANDAGNLVVPGREFNKAIYVDNTGRNDAYYRIRMIVTRDQFNSFYFTENSTRLEEGHFAKGIVAHYADGTTKDYSAGYNPKTGKTDFTAIKADADWTALEYIYTCTEILEAGELAKYSPVWKFQMKHGLDNEDVEGLKANTSILVYADAIQAEGFASAADAFAAFDKQEVGDKVEGNAPDSSDTEFETVTVVKNADELREALNNPDVPKVLVNGIESDDEVTLPAGKDVTWQDANVDTSSKYDPAVSVGENSNTTFDGGSYTAYEYAHVIDAKAQGSNTTLNGGVYEGNYLVSVARDAKVNVNGGTFCTGNYPGTVIVMCDDDTNTAAVNITGGTFYSEAICDNGVKVNISGGTFYLSTGLTNFSGMSVYLSGYITISGGTFNVDPTAWLADGCTAAQNADGMWVVSAN